METKAKKELVVLSKDEQRAVAADIFKVYPKAQKVSVASDGQAFITDDGDNAARSHAKNNIYGKELELTPFTRDGIEGETSSEKSAPVKADDLIALIEAAETAEAVNELAAGDTRKTVMAAAAKKLGTFKPAE